MPLFAVGGSIIGGLIAADGQKSAAKTQAAAAAEAAKASAFTPYGVASPFSTTSFITREQADANFRNMPQGAEVYKNANGIDSYRGADGAEYPLSPSVTSTRSAPVTAGTTAALSAGQSALQQANERASLTPEALAKDRFSRYLEMVRPTQANEFSKTLGALSLTGNLGYKSMDTGTNPVIESFAKGVSQGDKAAYDASLLAEQNLTDQLLARGSAGFSTAGGIDALATNDVNIGSSLGGRAMNTTGANILANAGTYGANQQATGAAQLGANISGGVNSFFSNPNTVNGIKAAFGGSNTTPQTVNPVTGEYLGSLEF